MDQQIAVSALAALAHDNRLSIFRLLVKCGPSGMAAGDIARVVGQVGLHYDHLKLNRIQAMHVHVPTTDSARRLLRPTRLESGANGDVSSDADDADEGSQSIPGSVVADSVAGNGNAGAANPSEA